MDEPENSHRLAHRWHLREHWSSSLTALLIASVLLLGAVSLLAARSLATLKAGDTSVVHTERVRFEIGHVLQFLTDVETGMRGYALSDDSQFLEPYHAALPLLPQSFANLKQLIADNPTQRDNEAELESREQACVAYAQGVVQQIESGDVAGARTTIASGEGKRRMDAARAAAAQMQAEEARLLELRRVDSDQALRNAQLALGITGALAVILLLVIAYSAVRTGARLRRGEKTLATTLRSVGDAVISTDATGAVQFMNAVAERLTAWDQKSARGRPLDEVFRIVNEQTRATVENPATKVLGEGAIVGLANHTVLIGRDGTERPIEDSGAPIIDGEALVGVVLVFRDATTERAAQRALLGSEQRFRAAVDAVQGVLWTNTAEGEMRGEQPGWAALTGQQRDDYQGYGWAKAVHPEDAQPTIDEWNVAVAARRAFFFEHRVKRHDGEWRTFSVRAVPTFADDGAIREWVGIHTDITERKSAKALQKQTDKVLAASEAWLRQALDVGRMVAWEWDVTSGISHRSANAADILGLHTGDAEDFYSLIQEADRARVEAVRAAALREGTQYDAEFRIVLASGRELWVNDRARIERDSEGRAVRLVGILTDVTVRKAAELASIQAAEQFTGLADNISQLAWMAEPDGSIFWYNKRWYEYTGTDLAGMLGWGWRTVHHPDHLERVLDEVRGNWERAQAWEGTYLLRSAAGEYRWFLTRAEPIRDPDGKLVRWFGTNTDISERLDTEELLREADQRKDVFLATLSHELRNPLAPIRTAAALLENTALKPQDVERSRLIIARQVRHMATLLDDLLDVSRITRGVCVLKKQYASLQGLLAEALETARPIIDAKRHRVTLDWPEEFSDIDVDPVRFVQVVSNLLTNAAKYTDPEGDIFFGARIENERLVITIRDTGIGITADMLPRVFEMFAQANPNQDRTEGGLGIGLALVKGLVELHGGRVEARSEGLEQGCEFTVFLPCLHVATGIHRQLPVGASAGSQGQLAVLIADDNRDGAESLAMLLELAGHQVHLAHTGLEAIDMAKQHLPAVAILDIGMPGLSGYEVAMQIRSHPWGAKIILIAITGWGQEDDKRRAHEAGFNHHLTKPVDPDTLERLITSGSIEPAFEASTRL